MTEVRSCVVDMAEELAKALGYNDYHDGYQIGTINSLGGYYDPTYKPPGRGRKNIPPKRQPAKKMILYPRGVTIYNPEYIIDIEADSTYEQWIVYSRGKIADVEKEIMPLLRRREYPWNKIKMAWDNDLERRKGLVANAVRGESSLSTPIHWSAQHHDRSDTYTQQNSQKTPTFGDLTALSKPTSGDPDRPQPRKRLTERWT